MGVFPGKPAAFILETFPMVHRNDTVQAHNRNVTMQNYRASGMHRDAKASRQRQGIAMISTVLSPTTPGQRIMNEPLVDQKQLLERHRP